MVNHKKLYRIDKEEGLCVRKRGGVPSGHWGFGHRWFCLAGLINAGEPPWY